MLNEKNLRNFENLVISEAENERSEVVAALKSELDGKVLEYKKSSQERLNENLSREFSAIKSKTNERIAEKSFEAHKNFLLMREKRINSLFEKVEDKLSEYIKTDDYVLKMKAQIEQAVSEKDGDFTVVVGANDKKLEEFLRNFGYKYEISSKNFGGGFRLIDNKEHILFDFTYKSRLKEENEMFFEKYF